MHSVIRRQDKSQSTFAYLYPFFMIYDVCSMCYTGTVLKRVCQHTINNPSVNDRTNSVS